MFHGKERSKEAVKTCRCVCASWLRLSNETFGGKGHCWRFEAQTFNLEFEVKDSEGGRKLESFPEDASGRMHVSSPRTVVRTVVCPR